MEPLFLFIYFFKSPASSPLQALEAKLSLDALLQMTGVQVRDTMRRLGSSSEECGRLIAALSCLKSATESGVVNASAGLRWMKPTPCLLLVGGWFFMLSFPVLVQVVS